MCYSGDGIMISISLEVYSRPTVTVLMISVSLNTVLMDLLEES